MPVSNMTLLWGQGKAEISISTCGCYKCRWVPADVEGSAKGDMIF